MEDFSYEAKHRAITPFEPLSPTTLPSLLHPHRQPIFRFSSCMQNLVRPPPNPIRTLVLFRPPPQSTIQLTLRLLEIELPQRQR